MGRCCICTTANCSWALPHGNLQVREPPHHSWAAQKTTWYTLQHTVNHNTTARTGLARHSTCPDLFQDTGHCTARWVSHWLGVTQSSVNQGCAQTWLPHQQSAQLSAALCGVYSTQRLHRMMKHTASAQTPTPHLTHTQPAGTDLSTSCCFNLPTHFVFPAPTSRCCSCCYTAAATGLESPGADGATATGPSARLEPHQLPEAPHSVKPRGS